MSSKSLLIGFLIGITTIRAAAASSATADKGVPGHPEFKKINSPISWKPAQKPDGTQLGYIINKASNLAQNAFVIVTDVARGIGDITKQPGTHRTKAIFALKHFRDFPDDYLSYFDIKSSQLYPQDGIILVPWEVEIQVPDPSTSNALIFSIIATGKGLSTLHSFKWKELNTPTLRLYNGDKKLDFYPASLHDDWLIYLKINSDDDTCKLNPTEAYQECLVMFRGPQRGYAKRFAIAEGSLMTSESLEWSQPNALQPVTWKARLTWKATSNSFNGRLYPIVTIDISQLPIGGKTSSQIRRMLFRRSLLKRSEKTRQ